MRTVKQTLLSLIMFGLTMTGRTIAQQPVIHRSTVILDTDIGDDMDDSWALVALLKNENLDLKLVTTTNGKNDYRANLIAKFLLLAGRTDIPVATGPGDHTGTGGQAAWLKDFDRRHYPGKISPNAPQAIVDLINQSGDEVTVIGIGPLQTLAAAISIDPSITARARFVGMQGSVYRGYDGSRTPAAEYNVKIDPAAARTVLSARWKSITLTPLDTCGLGSIKVKGQDFARLKESGDSLIHGLLQSYAHWSRHASVKELTESSTLFDTVAICLADPTTRSLLDLKTLPISVLPDGKTVVDPNGNPMQIATDWENPGSYSTFINHALAHATTAPPAH